jgi:hypothetical protein
MYQFHFLNPEYFFLKAYEFFTSAGGDDGVQISFFGAARDVIQSLHLPALVASILLYLGIIYAHSRAHHIVIEERKKVWLGEKREGEGAVKAAPYGEFGNKKWQKVLAHINSPNAAAWRLAVLEADIMLGEMLESMGYRGDSIGERLKGVEPSDFLTLDKAWDAHKVRNEIAHGGSDFLLNEREAKRVIALYEEVFKEFRYI